MNYRHTTHDGTQCHWQLPATSTGLVMRTETIEGVRHEWIHNLETADFAAVPEPSMGLGLIAVLALSVARKAMRDADSR